MTFYKRQSIVAIVFICVVYIPLMVGLGIATTTDVARLKDSYDVPVVTVVSSDTMAFYLKNDTALLVVDHYSDGNCGGAVHTFKAYTDSGKMVWCEIYKQMYEAMKK